MSKNCCIWFIQVTVSIFKLQRWYTELITVVLWLERIYSESIFTYKANIRDITTKRLPFVIRVYLEANYQDTISHFTQLVFMHGNLWDENVRISFQNLTSFWACAFDCVLWIQGVYQQQNSMYKRAESHFTPLIYIHFIMLLRHVCVDQRGALFAFSSNSTPKYIHRRMSHYAANLNEETIPNPNH